MSKLSPPFAFSLVCLFSPLGESATIEWADTGNDFNTGGNWIGGQAPGSSDVAFFQNAIANNPVLSSPATVDQVRVAVGTDHLNFSGDTLQVTSGTAGDRDIWLESGASTISNDLEMTGTNTFGIRSESGTTLTLSGNIYGSPGQFLKTGAGTLLINGNGFFSGNFRMQEGTVGGTGLISANASLSSPTDAPTLTARNAGNRGTLRFGGALTLGSSATWLVDLNNQFNGDSDLIMVTGALDLAGANLVVDEAGTFTNGNSYTIATHASLTGRFNGLANNGDLVVGSAGGLFSINYGLNSITLTAVPEPSTVLPLAAMLSLVVLGVRRREAQNPA